MAVYGSFDVKRKSRDLPSLVKPLTLDVTYNAAGGIIESNLVPGLTYRTGHEGITYSTKPAFLRTQSNYCKHVKQSWGVPAIQTYRGVATAPNPDGSYEFTSIDSHALVASVAAWTSFGNSIPINGDGVLSSNAQGYINDAFYAVKPDLTSLSIPNFLLELRDLPKLFQLWKTKLAALVNLARARLNWSFGWKPFVADLETIKETLLSVYLQCVEWNRKAGDLIHRKHAFDPVSDTASGNFVYPSGTHKAYWSGSMDGRITAHLVFKTLKIPELETMETILKVYLDALGFELNPKIIWDAIPFSFVLDWFFEVGGWLQRFKSDTLELPVVLADSYLQYKEGLRCETYWQRGPDGLYVPQPRSQSVLQDKYSFYRLPIFPDETAATAAGWKIPSRNQLINLFSLGTALRG
jgi:hypothetical protein